MFKSALLVLSFVATANAQLGCQGRCGDFNPTQDQSGQCYCDANCVTNGDCCGDYASLCTGQGGVPVNTFVPTNADQSSQCFNNCNSAVSYKSGGQDCYCEPQCTALNDCCPGYVANCGTGSQGVINLNPNAGNTPVGWRQAIDDLTAAFQGWPGPDAMGTVCQNRCTSGSNTDPANGAVCYCDDVCVLNADCCPGFLYHCDHPGRVAAVNQALAASTNPTEAADMCNNLFATTSQYCGGVGGCNCPNTACMNFMNQCPAWANQGYCDNGHPDGTPAGWFQWQCPQACNAC